MRSRTKTRRATMIAVASMVAVTAMGAGAAGAKFDFGFGVKRDTELANQSEKLFGVGEPLAKSSARQITQAQAIADPTQLVSLAKKLNVRVVTTQGPAVDDQIALWPDDAHPTHLIACNEQGTAVAGLVRIELATGAVETIVTGTTSCDPVRRTPWGTILFAEEAGQAGRATS